jgi:replicative DNA helicase
MTVSVQVISKVLLNQDDEFLQNNNITDEYFVGYEDEVAFIENHKKEYGNIPDKLTFLSHFPEFEIVDVQESEVYLVDKLKEEYLYSQSVPVVQKIAKLLETDSNAAVEYMLQATKELQPNYQLKGVDIIHDAQDRYDQFIERKQHQDTWFFTTGFPELDDIVHGIQRTEELVVIFARINQGKSWVLEKMCTHVWQLGFNVGYVSPEMTATSIGYRFDTLYQNFSNRALMWGKDDVSESEYQNYIDKLKENEHSIVVSTPIDFQKKITITKLRNWIKKYKLDMVAIDGITYLTDERYKRGDNKTTTLTNISEDLMELSIEMNVPILVVVQANRSGVIDKDTNGTPELENIKDSDGIAANASKVFPIRQKDSQLEIGIKKQRFGPVGGKVNYAWDIDTGTFTWVPSEDDAVDPDKRDKVISIEKAKCVDKADVF